MNDGGSEFPMAASGSPNSTEAFWDQDGMSLLQFYFAECMKGMLSNGSLLDGIEDSTKVWLVDVAYDLAERMISKTCQADAMLVERDKEESDGSE